MTDYSTWYDALLLVPLVITVVAVIWMEIG